MKKFFVIESQTHVTILFVLAESPEQAEHLAKQGTYKEQLESWDEQPQYRVTQEAK